MPALNENEPVPPPDDAAASEAAEAADAMMMAELSEDITNELGTEDAAAAVYNAAMTGGDTTAAAAAPAAEAEEEMAEVLAVDAGGETEAVTAVAEAVPEDAAPPQDMDEDDAPIASLKSPPGMPPLPPPKASAKSSLKPPPKISGSSSHKTTYYAVRVGYAVCPSCSTNARSGVAGCGHVSTIRSAIFLQWEDVQNFVEFTTSTQPSEGQVNAAVAAVTGVANIKAGGEGATAGLMAMASGDKVIPFHHNVEYKEFDELARAERYLTKVIPAFHQSGGSSSAKGKKGKKSKAHKAGKTKIKSLKRAAPLPAYPPPKNFNPPTKKWEGMYSTALQYRSTYGNLDVPTDELEPNYEEHAELAKWVKYQRTSYRYYLEDPMGGRHSMTEEKVNRLKEAGFTWIVSDKKRWLAEVPEEKGKRKRGRPRKTAQIKMEESEAASDILANAGSGVVVMKTKPIRQKWMNMIKRLKEYKDTHGTIEISSEETEDELVALRTWCKNQRNMHIRWRQGHDVGMTQAKADLLKGAGMDFPPSWEDMYIKIVQYKAQNGDIDISPDYDPILAAWMARQNEVLGRHLQGKSTRLNDDQAMRLLSLGFQGGRGGSAAKGGGSVSVSGKTVASRDFDARWSEMLLRLRDYKAEHGHCNVPTTTGTDLAHWVAAQRRMYNKLISGKPGKRAVLDAIKMQRLTELGFQFRPRGSYMAWDNQMKGLWKFREENGHCRIPVNHPTLGSFVKLVRRDHKNWTIGKPSSMTPEREAALKEVGFIFEGGKTPQRAVGPVKNWNERLDELLQYKAEFGHTVVPQNSGQLGAWVHSQRVHYKRYKEGQKSQMTAEKALKLTEIGFCFNASDRYRGNKRHRTHEQEEEDAALAAQQQQQMPPLEAHQQQQHYQQHHQMHETVQVPQGFQPYL